MVAQSRYQVHLRVVISGLGICIVVQHRKMWYDGNQGQNVLHFVFLPEDFKTPVFEGRYDGTNSSSQEFRLIRSHKFETCSNIRAIS